MRRSCAAYEQRVERLRAALEARGELPSISVIAADEPGTFYRADEGQALGTVTDDLDLPRPPAQARLEGAEYDVTSLEQLATADADVLYVVDFSEDGQAPGVTEMLESPLYQRLASVQAGQAHVVDGTETVGAAWSKMDAFLDVLEETLVETEVDTSVVSGEVDGGS